MNVKDEEWYPEHILSWYPHRDNKSVYFVAYEDLKKVKFILLILNCRNVRIFCRFCFLT